MNCPRCGDVFSDVCRCAPEPDIAATPRWMPDTGTEPESAPLLASPPAEQVQAAAPGLDSIEPAVPEPEALEESPAWREELSARLSHYRARRKPSPPRYPSLRLPFEDPSRTTAESGHPSPRPPAFDTVSNQALALDLSEDISPLADGDLHRQSVPAALSDPMLAAAPSPLAPSQPANYGGAKIIEFPRLAEMPPRAPSDELADPVFDRPRILEVPEVAPSPPALGGINMEGVQRVEVEKRPGIDIPLQSAPLARRVFATAIDGLIIAIASALFGYIFWKIAAVRPPLFQILGLAAGIPSLFWATYQYLLIVYSGSTPGIRLAGLELNRFDGTLTNRRLRRWRVLGSYLSAVSLGMGYAWVLLDEDSLCWHDRITHSYLAPRKRATAHSRSCNSPIDTETGV